MHVGYFIAGEELPEYQNFPNQLLGCCNGLDAGVRCCVIQSCFCCSGPVHAQALGLVNTKLGQRAGEAWKTEIVSAALRGVSDRNGNANPFAQAAATATEVANDFKYASIRERFIDLMYGVWRDRDGLELVWSPREGLFQSWLIQVFCAPFARCQETDAAMRWRQQAVGKRIRFSNPVFCTCRLEEEIQPGVWGRAMPRSDIQLTEERLLGRKGPPEAAPYLKAFEQSLTPMVALRM